VAARQTPPTIWPTITRDGSGARSRPWGLDANDFQIDASELRGYEWKLYHKLTGRALHVSEAIDDAHDKVDLLITRPDANPVAEERVDVPSFFSTFRQWAEELRTENPGAPTPTGSADGQAGENTPFTPAERAEIINQLRAIRDSVRKNYGLSAAQLAAIDNRLAEAEEASKRLGRKDWKSLFYGVVFGLIVNDAIPPDVAQHIFTGVVQGIAHLLGGGPPPGPWMLGR
jgi:hypothetical protein